MRIVIDKICRDFHCLLPDIPASCSDAYYFKGKVKMAFYPTKKLPMTKTVLASALLLAIPSMAMAAQSNEPQKKPGKLAEVEVKADSIEPEFIAKKASSPKQTQPLVDTPQTIVVVKKELFQQQAAVSLSDTLRNTPGITMLMGENGNTATGDSIFMRGFDTQGSIYVDGIRDLGTISRDVFNTDQVEIAKGPAGVDNGRSSSSGYVNMGSKTASLEDFMVGSATVGSGSHKRVTADINSSLAIDNAAIRVNLMRQDSGVTNRDTVENNSTGLAASLAFGLNTQTRTALNLLHVQQDNIQDGGLPTVGLEGYFSSSYAEAFPQGNGPALSKVDRSNFYGSASDYDHVLANMLTLRIEHDFTDHITLTNTSRYGVSTQDYVLTGVNALEVPTATKNDPKSWTVSRIRQGKDQKNQILINQSNLTAKFTAAGLQHTVASGIEFSYESQLTYSKGLPTGTTQLSANLYQPSMADVFGQLELNGAKADGSTDTVAIYAMDTVDLNAQWQLSAGVRAEHYNTITDSISFQRRSTPQIPAGTKIISHDRASDNLLSYKIGTNYKPSKNGSVYLSYATSQLPPGGTNFQLSSSETSQNNPAMEPQKGTNLELGTKWDLINQKLFATAAVFKSVNKNELVRDDVDTYVPVGEKTVKGVEFGLVGMPVSNLEVSAGLAILDPEITRGARYSSSATEGATIQWTPKTTFTLWSNYKWENLSIGGGVRYMDSVARSNNTTLNSATSSLLQVPDYWVVDAMASYVVTPEVTIQLNLYNLLDEEYIASLNNGGSRYHQGTPRSAKLGVNVAF
jgi:catecholate siderophore receptor